MCFWNISVKRRYDTQHDGNQHNDFGHNDTEHNYTQHYGTWHYGTQHHGTQHHGTQHKINPLCRESLSIVFHYTECHYAKYHYTECHYTECHYTECHYTECHYTECHYTECHYTEFHYAKCCSVVRPPDSNLQQKKDLKFLVLLKFGKNRPLIIIGTARFKKCKLLFEYQHYLHYLNVVYFFNTSVN
jgi:hypothetical protein